MGFRLCQLRTVDMARELGLVAVKSIFKFYLYFVTKLGVNLFKCQARSLWMVSQKEPHYQ
jgi:hypothetical protein